jgi:hypothetical protein
MSHEFRITKEHYNLLIKHLFPKDGFESVAVALCGRLSTTSKEILLVKEITLIPDELCIERNSQYINWPTDQITHYFENLISADLAIVKMHSHPGGYSQFSEVDDHSDNEFFKSVFGWTDSDKPHGSFVFLPDGNIFGRFFYPDLHEHQVDKITISGNSINFINPIDVQKQDEVFIRNIQAFGIKTNTILSKLKIAVIGCSGTGSPLIEQLARLGVGEFLLIDPDEIELKNLNRILNSTRMDAENHVSKVEMIKRTLENINIGTKVDTLKANLFDVGIENLKKLASCDIIFGCVDSIDGRHLLSHLCTFYLVPYFDVGVKLSANGNGGIDSICGSYNYMQPGMSTLFTRGIYNIDDLKAANQYRQNEDEYKSLKKSSYIKNVNVNSPAVISINMLTASHAVNDFLNRIHIYKNEDPNCYAQSTINVCESLIINSSESEFETDKYMKKFKGRGDTFPFLGLTEII